MSRPRWNSGMPVETMRVAKNSSSPLRGQREMPDGVVEPMYVAAIVIAEYRRGLAIRRSASTRPTGEIVTVTGVLVPAQEIHERERLFAAVRRGNKRAAAELWATRQAWIVPAGKGVVGQEESKPRDEAPGVAHEGAGALPTSEGGAR